MSAEKRHFREGDRQHVLFIVAGDDERQARLHGAPALGSSAARVICSISNILSTHTLGKTGFHSFSGQLNIIEIRLRKAFRVFDTGTLEYKYRETDTLAAVLTFQLRFAKLFCGLRHAEVASALAVLGTHGFASGPTLK